MDFENKLVVAEGEGEGEEGEGRGGAEMETIAFGVDEQLNANAWHGELCLVTCDGG